MPAASTSMSFFTLLRDANKMPTRPPKECPNRIGLSICSDLKKCSTACVYSSMPHTYGGSWLFPKPGKSMLYTLKCGVSRCSMLAKVVWSHPQPCIKTTGFPAPSTQKLSFTPSISICFSIGLTITAQSYGKAGEQKRTSLTF